MMRLIDANELINDIANHHYLLKDSIGSKDYGMFTDGLIQLINEQPDYVLEKREKQEYKHHDSHDAYWRNLGVKDNESQSNKS